MGSLIAFIGPSLPARYIADISHEWAVRPPVQRGDLSTLGLVRGDTVAIIDGVTGAHRALCHREVLATIKAGVRVTGAAGMGALRAAELCAFGMEGVGGVFEAFVHGELDGDDEVLVTYGEERDGYQPITEAMVNIRHRLRQAVDARVIDRRTATSLADIAKAQCFTKRTYPRLFELAAAAGIARGILDRLQHFVEERRSDPLTPDAQASDAIALLRSLTRTETEAGKPTIATAAGRPSVDVTPRWVGGTAHVSDSDIVNTCRVASRFYPEIHYAVAIRTIAADYGMRLTTRRQPDRVALARLRAEHSLESDDAFDAWLSGRSMTEDELLAYLRDTAIAQAAADAIGSGDTRGESTALEAVVAESLKSNGMLPESGAFPEGLSHWLSESECRNRDSVASLVRVATRACRISATHVALELKYRGLLTQAKDEAANVVRFRDAFTGYTGIRVSEAALLDWAAKKWAADDLDRAVLDRGFRTIERFQTLASLYFLYEQLTGAVLFASGTAGGRPATDSSWS